MPYHCGIENEKAPSFCACGKQFIADYAISCLKDGFLHRPNDELRDLFANLLEEVTYDVRVEPSLTRHRRLPSGSDDAHRDVATRAF